MPPPDQPSSAEIREVRLGEFRTIQSEVRSAQRGESVRALAGLLVPVVIALVENDSRGPVLIAAPLIMAFLLVYQINMSAHEAALRHCRDELISALTVDYPMTNIFRDGQISTIRDRHRAGIGAVTAIGIAAFLGLAGWGLWANQHETWLLGLEIASVTLALAAVAVASVSKTASDNDAKREFGPPSDPPRSGS